MTKNYINMKSDDIVDYTNNTNIIDGTEAVPLKDFLQITMLQKREECLKLKTEYYRRCILRKRNAPALENQLISKIFEIFDTLDSSLYDADPVTHARVLHLLNTFQGINAIEAFRLLNAFMYRKKITQFDNKKKIDETDPEARNASYGL